MNIDKIIDIKCGGEIYVDIEELHFFQNKLKTIDESKFLDLKKSLIKSGLPLGFHIWIDEKKKKWIMDGHHRWLALKSTREEGYFVAPVPCNIVKAKNKKEAAKIVLISNSRYAKINEESLSAFMIDFELQLSDLELLDIQDINMDIFNISETPLPELNDGDKSDLNQITFTINNEKYKLIKESLELAKERNDCDVNSENKNGLALFYICEKYLNG